jgi:hypothetical protein
MLGTRRLPGSPLILAVVVVAVALVAGAGVAMAATSGSRAAAAAPASSSGQIAATPAPSAPPGPGWAGVHRPGLRPGLGGGPFGAVHGQFVVPRSGGGYQTIDTQRGVVTAVSATSITIKSSDGFTKTYQVTSSTDVDAQQNGIGSVKTGHQAIVLATVSGSTATAARILDLSLLPAFHGGPDGPGRPGGWGWHSGTPASGTPASGAPASGVVG